MSKEKVVQSWKDPVYRAKSEELAPNHPAGEGLKELSDEKLANTSGAGDVDPNTLSGWLGNDGKVCTLTKECMPSCN
ncbi:plantaricin C family lantibiotic [Hazenella sp. IB182357]|uniref:Plantaricin C family lantibiotic n=1 Tax=Polycladospora coralii TaxID=2771432 RepID=A0A926N6H8_9BACL|nr:plantaricin C family lantibiotic [Polycladospora coralii]MBD1372086.1 plantaricin C family lantibiotic [Polycladospora coralii]MBS7530592.1 plantaricin C family lantibiotic [Polycladospora coralii]